MISLQPGPIPGNIDNTERRAAVHPQPRWCTCHWAPQGTASAQSRPLIAVLTRTPMTTTSRGASSRSSPTLNQGRPMRVLARQGTARRAGCSSTSMTTASRVGSRAAQAPQLPTTHAAPARTRQKHAVPPRARRAERPLVERSAVATARARQPPAQRRGAGGVSGSHRQGRVPCVCLGHIHEMVRGCAGYPT